MTNLNPAQPSQPPIALGIPSNKAPNFPSSSNFTTSSAPPISLPLTKTNGTFTSFVPISLLSSSLNPESIDISRSNTWIKWDSMIDLTLLQSSNVFLIPRSVVV
ncbi:hypothetical protein PanWU01x14_023620 [Parasponia andersonii]|uniref:Uncharacterized protein n=1 Tax=Parasponia andersonii TaxID=3476 RepID=A0A2P5DXI6_PARAD|nr:hypothetical protein PanWU01x14_023620 [Parasponia andersonii]